MAKVKQNLDLLREQYVRLQARYNELEQKHNKLLASSGGEGGSADGYVSRLIAMSNNLYDKPLYRCVSVCVSVCACMCLRVCMHVSVYVCLCVVFAIVRCVCSVYTYARMYMYVCASYVFTSHMTTHSDVIIKLADRQMPGHRLILATRSSGWDHQDDRMSHTKELDLSHLSPNVAVTIIKWVYTDQVQLPQDEAFVTETLVGAEKYKLVELKEK